MGGKSVREEILLLLDEYDRAVESGSLSERQIDQFIFSAEALVPHAYLGDLIFYGERERSREEAVDEAIYREQLWQSQGDSALLVYLEMQLRTALKDESLENCFRLYAEDMLKFLSREVARGASRLNSLLFGFYTAIVFRRPHWSRL